MKKHRCGGDLVPAIVAVVGEGTAATLYEGFRCSHCHGELIPAAEGPGA